jgi:predicted alpha/beta hydrolase family esterase
VHSDNDPFCPLEDTKYFASVLDAEFVMLPGNDHFSYELNPKHDKLPELLEILQLSPKE